MVRKSLWECVANCRTLSDNGGVGHCTVAILSKAPTEKYHRPIPVDTLRMNDRADWLRQTCVQSQGTGGKSTMESSHWDTHLHWPSIYLYAPDSKMKDLVELLYHCVVEDESGRVACAKRIPDPEPSSGDDAGSSGGVGAVPKGSKQACSGSCYDLAECDINSDCLCTAPSGGKSVFSHTC